MNHHIDLFSILCVSGGGWVGVRFPSFCFAGMGYLFSLLFTDIVTILESKFSGGLEL